MAYQILRPHSNLEIILNSFIDSSILNQWVFYQVTHLLTCSLMTHVTVICVLYEIETCQLICNSNIQIGELQTTVLGVFLQNFGYAKKLYDILAKLEWNTPVGVCHVSLRKSTLLTLTTPLFFKLFHDQPLSTVPYKHLLLISHTRRVPYILNMQMG